MERITSTYIHQLAAIYHKIDMRGMLFDEDVMRSLNYYISNKIRALLDELSHSWSCDCYLGADKSKSKIPDSINLGSSQQLLAKLKSLSFDIPKVRKKNEDTYEVEYKESVEELVLRKVFAETGSLDIQRILEIRELEVLNSRYVNARRLNGVFFSCYNTAGTITGRRGCKKHTFGVGGNAQTFPKHYSKSSACYQLGADFLQGIIARPNKLFFIVDQMSAEDWPVNALAGNQNALTELINQVDRHTNLASYIFGIPVQLHSRSEWKDSIERYLGKKSRHAFNYGMRGATMADSLAKEGFSYSTKDCQTLLDKVDSYDPSVERVFHKYVRDEVFARQTLSTPFGRERHFHGLRNNDSNYKVLNEAYSYIPQSVVADNTGFAVFDISQSSDSIINECHDSINQEIDDDLGAVLKCYRRTRRAFDRNIKFYNGIEIQIPIEGEMGYNLKDTVKIREFTEEGVRAAYLELQNKYQPPTYNFMKESTWEP